MTSKKPTPVDRYLEKVTDEHRQLLEQVRKTVLAVAPDAEECISYGLAAFRLNKRPLVAFGGWASHCAFYPMNASLVKTFKAELKDFKTSKGTIRFSKEQPIPAALLKKMVKLRVRENRA
jgi:uncharacterized protein YdhG (YjbR/CyaY superfamily)